MAIRKEFHYCILVLILPLALIAGKGDFVEDSRPVKVLETTTSRTDTTRGLIGDSTVRLPLEFLTAELGFTVKDLQGDRLGICYGDLCIPMQIGENPEDILELNGKTMVPMQHLYSALNGELLWDREANWLVLETEPSPGDGPLPNEPVDFRLPDMEGRPVQLSDFRGQRVILFAWASW